MSPIPFLAAVVIIGFRGYEAYQQSHHVTAAQLLPSSLALLAVALVFSLLMGWLKRRRKSRSRQPPKRRRRSRGSGDQYGPPLPFYYLDPGRFDPGRRR